MRTAIGLDIGGTKIAAGLVGEDGTVSHQLQVSTPAREGPTAVLAAAAAIARQVAEVDGRNMVACGVGTAGAVAESGQITHATATLPGWAGTDVRAALTEALQLPVAVYNDVHAMALAEARFGAAAGVDDALIVAVGTGIGGALIHSCRLRSGRNGLAGSLGHLPAIRRTGRICGCGGYDHVEAYAAGPAIAADYMTRTDRHGWRLEQVADAARSGDMTACAVIDEAADILGAGLAAGINLVDPDMVVLGGGVIDMGELLLAPTERAMRAAALPGANQVPLRVAQLGSAAVLVGAATAALNASPPESAAKSSPSNQLQLRKVSEAR